MKADKKLEAARKIYNALKNASGNRAFEMAVFTYADSLEEEFFTVRGINFNCSNGEAVIWGRWEDEDYDRRENTAFKLYETVNRYGTRYIAIDHRYNSYDHV